MFTSYKDRQIHDTKAEKSILFLYTKNEPTKKEIRKIILFTTASKKKKDLEININKEVKEAFYSEKVN